jgi:arylsulfatase A-like enzyme
MFPKARQFSSVAAATAFGWCLYDLAVVATTPEPLLARQLLAGIIVAIAVGAIAGLLWGVHRRFFWLTVIVGCGVCVRQFLVSSPSSLAQVWFPRALLLFTLSAGMAAWLSRRFRLRLVTTGLALGAVDAIIVGACVGPYGRRPHIGDGTWHAWLVLASVGLGLAAVRLPRPWGRLAVTAAVAMPLVIVSVVAYERAQLERADEPMPSVAVDPGRPNLVFIVLDTVRADHLAPYGYARVTTPGLDRFVQRCATRYTEAYSTSSWTLPSHGSLFTGLYPSEHGAYHCRTADHGNVPLCTEVFAQPLRPDVPTLAERLRANGYETGAIVANVMYLDHRLGFDRGFAHYDDRWGAQFNFLLLPQLAGFLPHLGHSPERSADSITDLAVNWITARSKERPFFLLLNYLDAHFPYLPPPPHDRVFGEEYPLNPYGPPKPMWPLLYDRELHFLDEQVTRLLHSIDAQGLMEKTVVIITSDHGEAFGEHGFWRHDRILYEEVLRVPLYVKGVGPCRGATSQAHMTGLDVYHLALRGVGLEADTFAVPPAKVLAELHGSPYLKTDPIDPPVDPNRDLLAWMEGRVKWIVSSNDPPEAYDLETDPGEQRNLATDADQVARARDFAAAWWAAHPPIVTSIRHPHVLDAESRDRMRQLGY